MLFGSKDCSISAFGPTESLAELYTLSPSKGHTAAIPALYFNYSVHMTSHLALAGGKGGTGCNEVQDVGPYGGKGSGQYQEGEDDDDDQGGEVLAKSFLLKPLEGMWSWISKKFTRGVEHKTEAKSTAAKNSKDNENNIKNNNENNKKGNSNSESSSRTSSNNNGEVAVSRHIHHRDNVVFVNRGKCTFEEKVQEAQNHGAVAVVVTNTDNNIFVMAGNSDLNKGGGVGSVVNRDSTKQQQQVHIPSVMVSKRDGEELMNSHRTIMKDEVGPAIEIDVKLHSNLLNSEYMGDFSYPKVHVTPGLISVMSRGSWSAILSRGESRNEGAVMEWKLFLTPKGMDEQLHNPNHNPNRKLNSNPKVRTSSFIPRGL